jgi:hypothetical protein
MIEIPVSIGELIDKITILRIKCEKIKDNTKLNNIKNELRYLNEKYSSLKIDKNIFNLTLKLYDINLKLWEVEDILRDFEREKKFGDEFIENARSVYILNDTRFSLKKEINLLTDSVFIEEKSYSEY